MTNLPAPLAEPLHILEPWPWRAIAVAIVAASLAIWLLWRWLRARGRQAEAVRPVPDLPSASAFAEAVERIRERARQSSFFRLGCHELAQLLRDVLKVRHGAKFAYLTARETAAGLDGDGYAELLVEVSAARFGRGVPSAKALDALCARALELEVRDAS